MQDLSEPCGYNTIVIKSALLLLSGIVFTGILCFKGCVPPRKTVTKYNCLKKVDVADYPVFCDYGDFSGLEHALKQSLLYFDKIAGKKIVYFGKDGFTTQHVKISLQKFLLFIRKNPSEDEVNRFIRQNYCVYSSVGGRRTRGVIFTGYYEPWFFGRLVKHGKYIYPLYSPPRDLVHINLSLFADKFSGEKNLVARVNDQKQVVPYFSRREIENIKNFGERAHPVVWLKSPVDRFFLEIQGSGKIILKKGRVLRVHYADSNGRRYRSIGRYLIARKEIKRENMSMQAIRSWLDMHPGRIKQVLDYNPSFVFFKKEKGGPFGCLGVAITPMRSIATDKSLFPKGALCFVKTDIPLKTLEKTGKNIYNFSGFVLNQDTGGAIKGAGRVDLFFGSGSYAEFAAGHMNQPGKLYFLVLKDSFHTP